MKTNFGNLWIGSHFKLGARLMHKTDNMFAMPITQPRFGSGGVGIPIELSCLVEITRKSELKRPSVPKP